MPTTEAGVSLADMQANAKAAHLQRTRDRIAQYQTLLQASTLPEQEGQRVMLRKAIADHQEQLTFKPAEPVNPVVALVQTLQDEVKALKASFTGQAKTPQAATHA